MQRRTNIPKKKFSNKLSRQFTTSPNVTELSVLGMLFQGNCRFTQHISGKLSKLNKCLYIITILRKEGTAQVEVDKLFETIVLPNILYGITVYGASEADLNSVQMFLDRCNKRKYTSTKMSERKLLENGDTKLFRKMKDKNHLLHDFLPNAKKHSYNLRKASHTKPKLNTERFKNFFVSRFDF